MSTQPDRHVRSVLPIPDVRKSELRDEMLYHRATQTYLWALPLINTPAGGGASGSQAR